MKKRMCFSGPQQWWTWQENWSGTNIPPSFFVWVLFPATWWIRWRSPYISEMPSILEDLQRQELEAQPLWKNGKGECGRHYRLIQHPVRAGQLIDSWLLRCRCTSSAATASWFFLAGYDMMARTSATILQPWWEG